MGEKMARSNRLKWSEKENQILRDNWANGKPIRMWVDLLPGRNEAAVVQRAAR